MLAIWHPEELIPQPQGYISLPMHRIRPPEGAIREKLGPLRKLEKSIQRTGVPLQPLCVRPVDPEWRKFEPIVGCRRYFACRRLGLSSVPCYIRPNVNETDIAAIALEENRLRKALTYREVYRAVTTLKDKGYTVKQISDIANMAVDYTMAYLRLSDMPTEVKKAFFNKDINTGHLALISSLNDDKKILEFLERITRENLSISALKQALKQALVLEKNSSRPSKRLLSKKVRKMLGKKLFLREGGRGVTLEIKANDRRELLRVFRELSGSMKLLCSIPWSNKPRTTRGRATGAE